MYPDITYRGATLHHHRTGRTQAISVRFNTLVEMDLGANFPLNADVDEAIKIVKTNVDAFILKSAGH